MNLQKTPYSVPGAVAAMALGVLLGIAISGLALLALTLVLRH